MTATHDVHPRSVSVTGLTEMERDAVDYIVASLGSAGVAIRKGYVDGLLVYAAVAERLGDAPDARSVFRRIVDEMGSTR